MPRVETTIGWMHGAVRGQWLFHWQVLQRRRRRSRFPPDGPPGVGPAATLLLACTDQPGRARSASHRIPTPGGEGTAPTEIGS